MISIAVVALLFILLIVFCVISAKHWHWSNIVFLILTYIAGVSATAALAQVLDGRSKALKAEKKSTDDLERYTSNYSLEVNGPADSLTYSEDSLRGRTAALELELHGRGRVWTGTATGTAERKTFSFPEPRDVDDVTVVSFKDVVMYAFLDAAEPSGLVIPKTFIGTVKVVSETAEAWTLNSEFLVREDLFVADGNRWTIYEKMPADRHETFIKAADLDIEDENFDIAAYRSELESKFFPANVLGFPIDSVDLAEAREAAIEYERFN